MSAKRKALEEEDEAFPRGRPSAEADAGDDDEKAARTPRVPLKGDKTRRKRAKTAEKVEEEEEDDTAAGLGGAAQAPKNATRLRSLDVVEGTMLMAAVREVHDDEITLSLPFNLTGYVSRVQAAETGESAVQPPPLPEAYPVGRLVVAVVTAVVEVGKKVDGKAKKPRIELSLRPSLANAGLTAEDITPHMWLPAVIESEEEHVFKLGFGVSGLQGLLKKTEASKLGKLPSAGTILQVGVQSCNAAAGLVRCTATTTESLGSSPLKLESLKAGFLVHARIDKLLAFTKSAGPDGFSNNGAVASFCGSLTGVINWHYQGQGAVDSPELTRKQRVTARVLAIVPGPKVLVHLALLPHLLDWTSQSELLTSVNIGDRLDGHVLDLLPKYGCRLRCMRQNEKLPLLGFCPTSYMTDTDAAETPAGLSSGSKTACRVLSYNFFDAALIVTRRQNDLQEDTLISVTELSPAQLVVGEIVRVAEYGVFVRLSEFITSLVHLRQLTDVPLATVPSRFQVGTKVKCRVLRVFPQKRQAWLTAKKALVRGDFQLAAFEQARKDMLVTGYVSKVQPYGAIVSFFGDVFGLLPAEEMEKDEAPALGMAVHCRISNYNKKRRRLALSVDLANGRAPADFAGSSEPAFLEDGAWAPGLMASVRVVECAEEGVVVKLQESSGKAGEKELEKDVRGFIPVAHLSDELEQAKARYAALRAALSTSGGDTAAEGTLALGNGVVLARRFQIRTKGAAADADDEEDKENAQGPSMVLISVKPSLRLAAEDGAFVTDISKLQAPRLYTGYVKRIHESGVIVSVGSWRISGFAPKHQLAEDYVENPSEMFTPGQSVRAFVAKVDVQKGRVQVSLRPAMTTLSDANLLRREAEALGIFFKLQAELAADDAKQASSSLLPGSVLDATVTAVKSYGVLMNLAGHKGLTALALKTNIPDGPRLKDGEKIKCAVLDLNVKDKIVDVSLQPELVTASASTVKLQPTSIKSSQKRRRSDADAAEAAASSDAGSSVQEVSVLHALQKPAYAVLWSKEPPAVLFAPPWEKKSWKFQRPTLVHSVPSTCSLFSRVLVRCPHGGMEKNPRRKAPRVANPEQLQVGSPVTMRVVSIKGLEVLCNAPVGLRGHVHATQFVDTGPLGTGGQSPLAKLQKKDLLEARILQVQQREKLWHLELTCRPALLTNRDACDYESVDVKWNSLSKGRHVSAAVSTVRKNFLWVEVAHGIQGRINSLDASTDVNVVRDLNKHFQQGQVYEALVLSAVSSKKSLDLVLHGTVEGPAPSGRTLARLERLEEIKGKGIAATFQLPGRRHGFVHVTELYDFWAQLPLKRLKPGTIYEAAILRGAVDAQGGKAEITLRASHVYGQAEGPEEARPLTAADLQKGQRVSGYVVNSNDKGVFVALSRSLVARIQLKSLSDQTITKDKVAHLHPPGELIRQAVVTAIDAARGHVELSLRKADSGPRLTVEQMSVGDILSGRVKAVEKYGLFVRLDNSAVDALVHRTEISDSASVSLESYQPGSLIPRAKVVKIENGKVWLGIKASLFEAGELEDEDEDLEEDEDALEADNADDAADPGSAGDAAADDDEPEAPPAKKARKAEVVDSDDEVPWDRTSSQLAKADAAGAPDVFQFAEFKAKQAVSEDEAEADSEDGDPETKRPSKRQKKAMKLAEAREVQQEEADNAEGRWATDPRSVEDFERLLLTEGDTSIVWIRYMAFHLKMSDLERARQVAERAVKHVGFAEGKERFNAWVAYMNLECTFGTEQTADAIFRRASSHNDAKQVHLQLARIHERNSKPDLAVRAYEACCKKFPQSKKVWLAYLSCLYNKQDLDTGRKALPKCLAALPRRKHPVVVSKAALLEYQHGAAERGRSVFEGLLDSYPKRTDLWSIYIDAHIKAHTPPRVAKPDSAEVRRLLERCCTMKLKAAKMRFFFKKWLDFEKKWGDAESQELVRSKAREFVEAQAT